MQANALQIFDQNLALKFAKAQVKQITVADFIDDFLGQFIAENTKREYLKDLNRFFDFLKSGGVAISHPREIQSFHFQIYRDDLMCKNLASATISRRLVAIRSFMKWAMGCRLISFNPLDCVKLPKVQTESETLAFDDDEAVAMISAPDTSTHRGRTHRLAMILLFNLGLRRSELVNIRIRDIYDDRGHKVLSIHGKGDKKRHIPLNEFVQNEITVYIEALAHGPAKVVLESADFLLQTSNMGRKNSKPINGSTIYRIIAYYSRLLEIDKRVSPHSCRATVISHLLDTKNAPIRAVAAFAGHSNITTTERYDKRRENLNKSAAYFVGLKDC